MKNKFIIFMTLILSLSVFNISCSDENEDFVGQDNYINKLSLEKDGIVYKAQIKGDSILITTPSNIDLVDANISSFAISENASIIPEPSTITEWSDDIVFKVNSYNNDIRTYVLKIQKTGVIENSNVTLLTQNDVNEFAKKGITIISGSLTIGDNNVSADSIRDLSILSQLSYIYGDLSINKNVKLNNLSGLENIISAGNIYIGSKNNTITTTDSLDISFDKLTKCGELIVNSSSIKSISLPKLSSVLELYIYSQNILSLNIPKLSNVIRDITITSNNNSNTQLKAIYFNELKEIGGSLDISYLDEVDTINMPLLKTIGNALTMTSVLNIKTLSLPSLQLVKGNVSFNKNLDITNLELTELTEVGSFYWDGSYSNFKLSNINLNKLIRVNGDFKIDHSLITEINLPAINYIKGQLQIKNSSIKSIVLANNCECSSIYLYGGSSTLAQELDFSTLKSLESLEIINFYSLTKLNLPKTINSLTLNGGTYASSFPEISGLEEVSGKLGITNYRLPLLNITNIKKIGSFSMNSDKNMTDFTFQDLEEIGNLTVGSYLLINFSAPKLKKAKNLKFSNIWALKNIDIPLLTEISEKFTITCSSYNASKMLIENLDAFTSLTFINSLDIENCANLVDFSGIKNAIGNISEADWKVVNCAYTPTYKDVKAGKFVKE